MKLVEAAIWGVTGGFASGLVSLSAAIVAAKFHWPWRYGGGEFWPRVFVTGVGIVLGGIVAAAAHTQITGPWPALIMGVSAPSVIRGILSGVDVTERTEGS
jgi:hypothetical protein